MREEGEAGSLALLFFPIFEPTASTIKSRNNKLIARLRLQSPVSLQKYLFDSSMRVQVLKQSSTGKGAFLPIVSCHRNDFLIYMTSQEEQVWLRCSSDFLVFSFPHLFII